MSATKQCIRCESLLDLSSFQKKADAKDNHKPWCKECSSSYNKEYYIENREAKRLYNRVYYKRNKSKS